MGILKNVKHEKFCQLITQGEFQCTAYKSAYPKSSAYTSRICSSQLLTKINIQTRLDELKQKKSYHYDLSKERIYSILDNMLKADTATIYLSSRKKLEELPKQLTLCIKSISDQKDGGIKVEMYSKTQVIEIANKMLGHNSPDVVKHSFTFADIAAAAEE